MAAGVGLVPATAQAAGPAAPAAHGAAAPGTGAKSVAVGESPSVELYAYGTSARQVTLYSDIKSAPGAALDIIIDWGDGKTEQLTASGSTVHNTAHTYAAVGSYTIAVTAKDTTNGVQSVKKVDFVTRGAEFTPHAPTRVLDTRSGLGAAKASVGGRKSVVLKVAGTAAIPADVTAVALNVTVTNTTGSGHITVQPGKEFVGAITSNLNYVPGQSVPNLVIVPVRDGHVQLFNGGWSPVDLIADVTGYFKASPAGGYAALTPVRAVDTREGLGAPKGQVPGYGSIGVEMADRRGVPKGATAVALNLTVTNPRASGHLTAYPSGQAAPTTSNVNFTAGQTVANSVIVPIGADGKISVRNGSWEPADVVLDVVGYYGPDSRAALVPADEPFRLVDTREDAWFRKAGPVAARTYLPVPLMGETPAPVAAWVLNTTVTNTTGAGFLSVTGDPNTWGDYQKGTAVKPERPVSSALNWTAGTTVPNLVQTSGGKEDVIDFWNQGWDGVDVVVDCLGYYMNG